VSECLYQLPETTLRKLAEDVAKKVGFAAPVGGTYAERSDYTFATMTNAVAATTKSK
jgi:hypothetical protein